MIHCVGCRLQCALFFCGNDRWNQWFDPASILEISGAMQTSQRVIILCILSCSSFGEVQRETMTRLRLQASAARLHGSTLLQRHFSLPFWFLVKSGRYPRYPLPLALVLEEEQHFSTIILFAAMDPWPGKPLGLVFFISRGIGLIRWFFTYPQSLN